MKTQYFSATSLDGFIATEDDSLDWLFPLGDVNDTGYPAFIAEVGALAMGSTTYEWMLRHALSVANPDRLSLARLATVVGVQHRSLPRRPGADLRFVRGDVRPVHDAMRHAAVERRTSGSWVAVTLPANSTMLNCLIKSSCRSAP